MKDPRETTDKSSSDDEFEEEDFVEYNDDNDMITKDIQEEARVISNAIFTVYHRDQWVAIKFDFE